MTEQLRLRGHLKGHGGWVTQIATSPSQSDMIMSSSRGVFDTMYAVLSNYVHLVIVNWEWPYLIL